MNLQAVKRCCNLLQEVDYLGSILLEHLDGYTRERETALEVIVLLAHLPVTFPRDYNYTSECPHQNMLFRMSSLLPESLESVLEEQRTERGPYRCVAFNASFGELMSILNIGSESATRN